MHTYQKYITKQIQGLIVGKHAQAKQQSNLKSKSWGWQENIKIMTTSQNHTQNHRILFAKPYNIGLQFPVFFAFSWPGSHQQKVQQIST